MKRAISESRILTTAVRCGLSGNLVEPPDLSLNQNKVKFKISSLVTLATSQAYMWLLTTILDITFFLSLFYYSCPNSPTLPSSAQPTPCSHSLSPHRCPQTFLSLSQTYHCISITPDWGALQDSTKDLIKKQK